MFIGVQTSRSCAMGKTIRCPGCNQEYKPDESLYGQHVNCQVCGTRFFMERPQGKKTQCIYCKGWFDAEEYDQKATCPHCGEVMYAERPSLTRAAPPRKARSEKKSSTKRKVKLAFRIALIPVLLLILGGVIFGQKNKESKDQRLIRYAREIVEEKIRKQFKYPAEVEFIYDGSMKDGWIDPLDRNRIVFNGHVTAKNGFGVKSRYSFDVKIDLSTYEDGDYYYPYFFIREDRG